MTVVDNETPTQPFSAPDLVFLVYHSGPHFVRSCSLLSFAVVMISRLSLSLLFSLLPVYSSHYTLDSALLVCLSLSSLFLSSARDSVFLFDLFIMGGFRLVSEDGSS
jgi:hypothetical protein